MKLTAGLTIFLSLLGPSYALAHHRHHGHEECLHHRHAERDPAAAARQHRAVAEPKRVNRASSREARGESAYGRVLAVEPVYRYYKEPVNAHSCIRIQQSPRGFTSYTGTVLGAVVGAALGHRVGDAHGDPTAAAVAGGVLGASVGRDIQRRSQLKRVLRVEGPCRLRQQEETRRQLVEYMVTYRYNGAVHSARMDYDPGEWIKLDVDVTPA